jgi:hypothetical protein
LAFGNVYASLRLKPKRIMVAWEVYQFRYFGEEVLCGFGSLNGVVGKAKWRDGFGPSRQF